MLLLLDSIYSRGGASVILLLSNDKLVKDKVFLFSQKYR